MALGEEQPDAKERKPHDAIQFSRSSNSSVNVTCGANYGRLISPFRALVPSSGQSPEDLNATATPSRWQQTLEQHNSTPCLDHKPPITARKLSELEVRYIIVNPEIRHEVNFEVNCHFTPNTDGYNGQRRQDEAELYWMDLEEELQQCNEGGCNATVDHTPKLREALRELRHILQRLVNERDQTIVKDMLDVDLLIQQICCGSLDYFRLSTSLAHVLKQHCAPLRDQWVDHMVEQFRHGVTTRETCYIVKGVRMLFGLLELMKLDVANHLIQMARPLLIDDTVKFEQTHFLARIGSGQLDPIPAMNWYSTYRRFWGCREDIVRLPPQERFLAIFLKGFLDLLRPCYYVPWPMTLVLDFERLKNLRLELHSLLALEICLIRFRIFLVAELSFRKDIPVETMRCLRAAIIAVHDDLTSGDVQDRWLGIIDRIAVEIYRHAQALQSNRALSEHHAVEGIEESLHCDLQFHSLAWHHQEHRVFDTLWSQTLERTLYCLTLTPYAVAELKPGSVQPSEQQSPTRDYFRSDVFAGISTSLAQVACLHWRVFGPLVYLQHEEFEWTMRMRKQRRPPPHRSPDSCSSDEGNTASSTNSQEELDVNNLLEKLCLS